MSVSVSNRILYCVVGVLCSVMCSVMLPAQDRDEREKRRTAQRWVSFLELPERRREASRGLMKMGAKITVPVLTRKLTDPRVDVVCRCVHLLTMFGERAAPALPQLEALAKSKDTILAHAGRWGIHRIKPTGITIAVNTNKDKIFEIDASGKLTLDLDVNDQIWDAELLANGNFLVCKVQKGEVVEMDRSRKVVWKFAHDFRPTDADRLPNGNTLICGGNKKKVLEVDPKGKIVWQWETKWPNDADRLPSGNTIVSDFQAKRLVEVDPSGKIVWEVKTPGTIDVERLLNGNTLTVFGSSAKSAAELDVEGNTVREWAPIKTPKAALRLFNGHMLIGGLGGIVELDTKDKVVWKAPPSVTGIYVVHRY